MNNKKRLLVNLLAAVVLTAALSANICASGTQTKKVIKKSPQSQAQTVTADEEESTEEDYADEMVKQINQQRKKAGKAELKHSEELDQAAAIRAKEMLELYDHTRPDGTSWKTVLDDQKISYIYWGENINEKQKTVSSTMKSWMNSQGHKDNILSSNFDSVGVARAKNSKGSYYWVQIFTGGSK